MRFKTGADLVHVWANRGEECGYTRCPIAFDGPLLTYDQAPVAMLVGSDYCLINSTRYRHYGIGEHPVHYWARRAEHSLPQGFRVLRVPSGLMRSLRVRGSMEDVDRMVSTIVKSSEASWEHCKTRVKFAKARRHDLMLTWNDYTLNSFQDQLRAIEAVYGIQLGVTLSSRFTTEELRAAIDYSDKWADIDSRRVVQHGAFGWRPRRHRLTLEERMLPITLALQESEVVTSRGARLSVDQAHRLLRLVRTVRKSGADYTPEPGDKSRFGYYTLTRITASGELHIGCHTISPEEIDRFAPELEGYMSSRQGDTPVTADVV